MFCGLARLLARVASQEELPQVGVVFERADLVAVTINECLPSTKLLLLCSCEVTDDTTHPPIRHCLTPYSGVVGGRGFRHVIGDRPVSGTATIVHPSPRPSARRHHGLIVTCT